MVSGSHIEINIAGTDDPEANMVNAAAVFTAMKRKKNAYVIIGRTEALSALMNMPPSKELS